MYDNPDSRARFRIHMAWPAACRRAMYSLWKALKPTCASFLLVVAIGPPANMAAKPYLLNPSSGSGLLDASENMMGIIFPFDVNRSPCVLWSCIHFSMCMPHFHACSDGLDSTCPNWLHPCWHSGNTPRVAQSSMPTSRRYPLACTIRASYSEASLLRRKTP